MGQKIDQKFQQLSHPNRFAINEEVFEWIHLFSAILDAEQQFVMFELGAGYGHWSIAAACALRQKRPTLPFTLTAIEAEPTHFEWLNEHFINNGISPENHRLIQAAIDGNDGEVNFVIGNSREWYGQAIVSDPNYQQVDMPQSYTIRVPAISLNTLLIGAEKIDYLDMDIQGAELSAIETGIGEMTRCVQRVFIGTHSSTIDQKLPEIFHSYGWDPVYLYPCGSTSMTQFGEISFGDGIQCWKNPALSSKNCKIEGTNA